MSFLVPAFLIGLAVLAVPVLVHLRQREQREPVRFPSLMFLARVTHRTTERRRITNRVLLLLRALAVTALVLAFARPFLERDPRVVVASRPRALVVLLDRSMSMSYAGVWARALDSARAAIGSLAPGERAALVAFDETATIVEPLTESRAALDARLAGLEPGTGGTRIAPAFRAAHEIATGARDHRVEIVLISDLQRHALPGLETVDPVPGATIRVARVSAAEPANARVVSTTVDRSVDGRQAELRVAARVASEGGRARDVAATLTVNGRELSRARASVPASGVATVTFPAVRIPDGDAAAVVALAADDLAADDAHRFVLGGPAGVRVALVLPPGMPAAELLYLERALSITRAPALLVETHRGTITAGQLAGVAVAILADLAPSGPAAAALGRFVERGGGLVAFAGPRLGGARVERAWLPARVGAIVDRTRDRGASLGWIQGDHPIFEPFREAVASDFGAARFFRFRELTPDSSAQTLARFDEGQPAIVEGRHGRGRVVLLAVPADAMWSDLPLQPVFLPLLHRAVRYAGQLSDDRRAWEAGDVATLPATGSDVVVKTPSGDLERVAGDTGVRTFRLAQAGFYEVRGAANDRTLLTLAVNPPAVESDLATAEAEEVTALLRPIGDSTARGAEPAALTATEQEARQSWWLWLLAAAIGLLGIEAWYAGALSRPRPKGGIA